MYIALIKKYYPHLCVRIENKAFRHDLLIIFSHIDPSLMRLLGRKMNFLKELRRNQKPFIISKLNKTFINRMQCISLKFLNLE